MYWKFRWRPFCTVVKGRSPIAKAQDIPNTEDTIPMTTKIKYSLSVTLSAVLPYVPNRFALFLFTLRSQLLGQLWMKLIAITDCFLVVRRRFRHTRLSFSNKSRMLTSNFTRRNVVTHPCRSSYTDILSRRTLGKHEIMGTWITAVRILECFVVSQKFVPKIAHVRIASIIT